MGCFFACFRSKSEDWKRSNLVSKPPPLNRRDAVRSRNQLASVFLYEDKGSPDCEAQGGKLPGSTDKGGVDGELKHEAKFLKSIGILQETPKEIGKVSEKSIVQTTNADRDNLSSNIFLLGMPCTKLEWDKKLGHVSDSCAQQKENSALGENKSEGSCKPEEHQVLSTDARHEAVAYKSEFESGQEVIISDIPELQTPRLESIRAGNYARIRTQYVYPVRNPIENSAQWKALREDATEAVQLTDHSVQHIKASSPGRDTEHIFRTPLSKDSGPGFPRITSPVGKIKHNQAVDFEERSDNSDQTYNSPDTPQFVVSSLSHWLKPQPPNVERKNNLNIANRSPDAERPIIGLVATHWNNDEPSENSQKWWDGNGIPNSTNKYKEDQKVSWHATPFEERLEKALSDEKLFPQRKVLNGKAIKLEEDEERDTAAS